VAILFWSCSPHRISIISVWNPTPRDAGTSRSIAFCRCRNRWRERRGAGQRQRREGAASTGVRFRLPKPVRGLATARTASFAGGREKGGSSARWELAEDRNFTKSARNSWDDAVAQPFTPSLPCPHWVRATSLPSLLAGLVWEIGSSTAPGWGGFMPMRAGAAAETLSCAACPGVTRLSHETERYRPGWFKEKILNDP